VGLMSIRLGEFIGIFLFGQNNRYYFLNGYKNEIPSLGEKIE